MRSHPPSVRAKSRFLRDNRNLSAAGEDPPRMAQCVFTVRRAVDVHITHTHAHTAAAGGRPRTGYSFLYPGASHGRVDGKQFPGSGC